MKEDIHTLGKLFEEVQLSNVLGDGKTFPDCTPKTSLEKIKEKFEYQRSRADFDLKKFVLEHFNLPEEYAADYTSDKQKSIVEYIQSLWPVLTREPSKASGSLIHLPHPYIVPGGRFREVYYWDSYFTMLGLKESGRWNIVQNMVDNFAYLIDTYGYIPNGNRTYYLGRSQPPFFSLMVSLLNEHRQGTLIKYFPQLEY
jgi:alpha,alpha-trehalase